MTTNMNTNNNTSKKKGGPEIMDNVEQRMKMLSTALDSTGHGSPDTNTTQDGSQHSTPIQNKVRQQAKTAAQKLKERRVVSSNPNEGTTQNANPTPQQNESRNTIMIEGTNIGSRADEPNWTTEELQKISDACGKRLQTVMMAETRRSFADPQQKYLTTMPDGTTMTKKAAILPNISLSEFSLGLGKIKGDEKTGKSKLYSDVVMKGPNWLLSQWTSKDVVMEGVANNILDKPPRMINGRPERRIGHDFARIGLPKTSFGPVFETLKEVYGGILESVSVTRGYYWLNASWGVTGSPGNFIYTGPNKIKQNTYKLYEAMKMISGYSSFGAAAIAISVAGEARMERGKMVPVSNKFELSIKLHNMFHVKKVTYRSPPQSASTGFEVTDDIYDEAEILEPSSNTRSARGYNISAIMRRNPMMFMRRNPNEFVARFVTCSEANCTTTSGVTEFKSMTLRTGLSYCTEHVTMSEIKHRLSNSVDVTNTVLIFYDIELSKDGEIEQLGACTESGQSFSAFIRTSVRTNSSPFLKKITPEYWSMLAEEPRFTMERFISWVNSQSPMATGPNSDKTKIMLAAHFGSCHDHVHLLRTMMKWGLTPPNYMLVDTLTIFKVMKGMNDCAKLSRLVSKYASWIDHVPHDADSDAEALRFMTMIVFPNTKLACHTFGITCKNFMDRTGLSMYVPSPIITMVHRKRTMSVTQSGDMSMIKNISDSSSISRSTI